MQSRNKAEKNEELEVPTIDAEVEKFAKESGFEVDRYFPPVRLGPNQWAFDGTSSMRCGNTLTGNVNLGNRIFTNDTLTILGKGKCKITPANDFASHVTPAQAVFLSFLNNNHNVKKILAKAKIDGIEYEGKEILIDKKDVFVDGTKMTDGNVPQVAFRKVL